MERFARVLRRVDRELEVRDPERARILLELAGDLEELYRAYRRRGCSEEEARRRAEAWLAPDGASLDGLRRLHTPLAGRLLDSLSHVARSRLEAAAFTVLALGAVVAALGGLRGTGILWPPGPAAAAVLGLGGLGFGVAALRAYRLVLAPDGPSPRPADPATAPPGRASAPSPSGTLLAVAAGAVVVGALGACLELEGAFAEASALAAPATAAEAAGSATAASTTAPRALWSAASEAAGTAALGLLVALTLAPAWLWLEVRVRRARLARAELLEVAPTLQRGSEPREPGRSPR